MFTYYYIITYAYTYKPSLGSYITSLLLSTSIKFISYLFNPALRLVFVSIYAFDSVTFI